MPSARTGPGWHRLGRSDPETRPTARRLKPHSPAANRTVPGRDPARYRVAIAERTYSDRYLDEVANLARAIDPERMEAMVAGLRNVRDEGRLFVLGVGGGAGHASHAVNDFRKLCGFEAYTPTDNVSELTARTNDEGWESSFSAWLRGSRLSARDALLIFSVGGGSREPPISMNLVEAIDLASEVGAGIFAIVGKPDGAAARSADVAIVIGAPPERLTPHVEGLQAVVWHALVSHPALATAPGKWESVAGAPSTAAR